MSQYVLHYLLSVRSLLNRHAWSRTPIAETALAVLKDSYHGSVCVRHKPQHLALTSLYLALQTYGVQLPRGELEWWQVGVFFCCTVSCGEKHKMSRQHLGHAVFALSHRD